MRFPSIEKRNNAPVEHKQGSSADDGEKEWPQILAVVLGSLPALSCGFHIAWTSTFLLKISRDEDYGISEKEASYLSVWNLVGLFVFSLLLSIVNVTDIFGRKVMLMLSAFPHSLAWILEAFSKDLYILYAARFVAGTGDALYVATIAFYIGEATTPKVRGVWGNYVICINSLGQLLMNVIGVYFDVQQTSFICLTVPVMFLISFSFMPESPYYYLMKSKEGEARDALRYLRGKVDVENELSVLKVAVSRQISESGKWGDILNIASNKKALVACLFLRISQVFCGFCVFSAYLQFVFDKSGGNVSPELSSIVYAGLSFILSSASAFFSDKLGRKKSFIISLSLSSSVLLLEGVYLYIDQYHPEIDFSSLKWFPLAGMLTFIAFSSFGIATIPSLMAGELFSVSVKVKCVNVVMVVFSLTSVLTYNLFYSIFLVTGLCGPFLIFGASGLLAAILTNYIVPETSGKTLEEIQQELKR
ncbi:hypothetical protein JTB14_016791 [Gonioctena quinquepunctata]|nr:hypothetical protein JTB14_016791 [Gonioctena quinquepunctata]